MRPAERPEIEALAAAMAKAFVDDPVWTWFLPRADRLVRLRRGFRLFLGWLWLRHDLTFTSASRPGAACWLPPGRWHPSPLVQAAMLPGLIAVFGSGLTRAGRGLARIEAVHPTEPHYYLAVVGVEPAWQGQGLGSALMQPALQRCDAEGVGAYLEASTRMSRALYERHGFSVIDEVRLPEGPPLWPMWREPRTG